MDGSKIESTAFIYERPKIDRQLVKEVTFTVYSYQISQKSLQWISGMGLQHIHLRDWDQSVPVASIVTF